MANDKKMELMLQIKAEGAQALAHLQTMNKELGLLDFNASSFKGSIGAMFSGIASGIGTMVLKPLELAGKATLGLGAGMIALGATALSSGAELDMLQRQMINLAGSSDEAARFMKIVANTPLGANLSDEELYRIQTLLISMGIRGSDALGAVTDASAATGIGIDRVVRSLNGMDEGAMRRFGITMDKTWDDKKIIRYTDQLGNAREEISATDSELQENLMAAFSGMFGGSGAKMRATMAGQLNALKQGIGDTLSHVGLGMGGQMTGLFGGINSQIEDMIKSGELEKLGTKVGIMVTDAVGIAVEAWNSIMGGDASWEEKLKAIMIAVAQTLATSFATYLVAYAGVFRALAHMMALSFGAELIQLPGMGGARVDTAVIGAKRLAGMGQAGMEELGDLAPGVLKDLANPEFRKYRTESQIIEDSVRNASKDEQMGLVKSIPIAGQMQTELDTATAGLGGLGDHLKGQLTGIWGQATTNTGIEGGVSGIAERGRERAAEWRSSIVVQGDLHVDADSDSTLRRDIHLMVGNPLPAAGGN